MGAPSGLPRDKAFPRVRVGEIDYEGQIAEFAHGLRSLRRVVGGVVACLGILTIVLVVAGRTAAASGLFLTVVFPLATVLAIVELIGLVGRRRRHRQSASTE